MHIYPGISYWSKGRIAYVQNYPLKNSLSPWKRSWRPDIGRRNWRRILPAFFYSLGSTSWGSNTLESLSFKEFNQRHSSFWPPKLIFLFLETFIPLTEWVLLNSCKFKVPMVQLYYRCSKRLIRVSIYNAKHYYLFNL